jgi:hypothetical protein
MLRLPSYGWPVCMAAAAERGSESGVLDSLAFVELMVQIEDEFGITVSLDDLGIDRSDLSAGSRSSSLAVRRRRPRSAHGRRGVEGCPAEHPRETWDGQYFPGLCFDICPDWLVPLAFL